MKFLSQILGLPICPRCKDTKYVHQDPCIISTYQFCTRCSISWNTNGLIKNCEDHGWTSPLKQRIRKEAHRLWEEAGKPEGDGKHFWYQAEKNIL